MKHHLLSKFWLAALMVTAGLSATAAGVEGGKVYRLVNCQYKTAVTSNGPTSGVTCSMPADDRYDQLWIAEATTSSDTFCFRNVLSGDYLNSSNVISAQWNTSASITGSTRLSVTATDNESAYVLRPESSAMAYGYMHCDASAMVVCWDATANASKWQINEVDISAEEIEDAGKKAEELSNLVASVATYDAILGRIFADKACTRLVSSPSQADIDALPAELKQMVYKIRDDNWEETDKDDESIAWDSGHARRFRVRDYKVYSRGMEITALTGTQAYTNMNNPTGIMGNAYDALYIMVDEAPVQGATLYFSTTAHNGFDTDWRAGYELKQGLNIIPVWNNNSMGYVYYTADTWAGDSDRKTLASSRKLSDFPPIKIHIEGGVINSYWDKNIDNEEDWQYYRQRARHTMYDILGDYMHIRFFFDRHGYNESDAASIDGLKQVLAPGANRNITRAIDTWDRIFAAQSMAIGTMSDSEIDKYGNGLYNHNTGDAVARSDVRLYFNNRHMGIQGYGVVNPNASHWRTMYPPSSPAALMDLIEGDTWTVHHEFGHNNQGPMNMIGQTEMSNNALANIAFYSTTNGFSRTMYFSDAARNFNEGGIFQQNTLWSCPRMYFQLWLYYHYLGHNRSFFPRLYEYLRRDPLVHHPVGDPTGPTRQTEDCLKFARYACLAAGEDLTEFFEGWGFLTPCDNYLVGDYTDHYTSLTQEEADRWREEIKALDLPKNITPLFIDDRPGDTERYYRNDNPWDSRNASELIGDLGGVVHFKTKSRVTQPYSYFVSGNSVIMEGGVGGIGFVVRDNDGRMIAFSNSYKFDVNPATLKALIDGDAKIYAIGEGRDTEPLPCASGLDSATPEKLAELLEDLIKNVNTYVDNIDDEGIIVGKYKPSAVGTLRDLRNEAREMLDKGDSDNYRDMLSRLSDEFYSVDSDPRKAITVISGSSYLISNKGLNFSKSITADGSALAMRETDSSDEAQQWVLESDGNDRYYIRSVSSGLYVQGITSNDLKGDDYVLASGPVAFTIGYPGPSDLCLYPNDTWNHSINYNRTQNRLIGYNGSDSFSQWRVMLVKANEAEEVRAMLDEQIEKTEQLVAEAGEVGDNSEKIAVPRGEEDKYFFSNAKCKEAAYGDKFTGFGVINDGSSDTFFHSDYSGADSDDGLDHYLGIDLCGGDASKGQTVSDFKIMYTTRGSGNVCAPTRIVVQVSTDGDNWADQKVIASGLPATVNTEYVSDIISVSEPVRYIRMMVTSTSGGQSAGGHQYFVVSEFGAADVAIVTTPSDKYPGVTAGLFEEVYTTLRSAMSIAATSNDADTLRDTYDTLLEAYNRLKEAMGQSGIDSVEAASPAYGSEGIYDLQGRRLKSASRPGLYIINGVKTVII